MKRLISLLLILPVASLAPLDQSEANDQSQANDSLCVVNCVHQYQYTFETDPFTFNGVAYPADGFSFTVPWPCGTAVCVGDLRAFSYLGAPLQQVITEANGLSFAISARDCSFNMRPPHGSEFCILNGGVTAGNVVQSIIFPIFFEGATAADRGTVYVPGTAIVSGIPVPELSTAPLLLLGLAGLAVHGCRRRSPLGAALHHPWA